MAQTELSAFHTVAPVAVEPPRKGLRFPAPLVISEKPAEGSRYKPESAAAEFGPSTYITKSQYTTKETYASKRTGQW